MDLVDHDTPTTPSRFGFQPLAPFPLSISPKGPLVLKVLNSPDSYIDVFLLFVVFLYPSHLMLIVLNNPIELYFGHLLDINKIILSYLYQLLLVFLPND